MRRTGGNKLLITASRKTMPSKKTKQTEQSDRVTGAAERWRSWKRGGGGGVWESCSEDFN